IGSFFMINLCLVVIATQFSETKQREHQLMQEQRARCLSSSTLASLTEPGDCYEELFQLVCHVLRKARRRSVALYYTLRGKAPPPKGGRGRRRGGVKAIRGEIQQCRSTQVSHCPHHSKVEHSSQTLDNSVSLSVPPNPEDCPECTALSIREGAGPGEDLANGEEGDGALEEADREENHLEERIDEEEEEEDDEEEVDGQKKKKKKKKNLFWKCKDLWDEMRLKLWSIVESKYFNRGIMMAILINTISMGIEHHNQVKHITFNL
ncbi:voltage-dependent T-type calcium channel subunit alpha-1I-like, partial [Tachysurus ichikawai]